MITIQSYGKNEKNTLTSEINKSNSILLIGSGFTNNRVNEIYKPIDINDMKKNYGDSELTTAYTECYLYGATNIFVINCYKTTDFIDIIDYIKYYNFSYIVPIDIKISDIFYSDYENRSMYFAEFYLKNFGEYTNSLIIFTDEHASLYEDIDSFIKDMNEKITNFKNDNEFLLSLYGRNLAFCTNNIKDRKYSNAILASILSNTYIGNYPDEILDDAIFNLDDNDITIQEIIYFKNNFLINTTVENLKNFRTKNDPNKIIPIDMVIKYIEKKIDMSFIIGKTYNQFMEMEIREYLDNFFRPLLNTSIRNYCIKEVNFIKTEDFSGYVVVNMDICPINSLDTINILLEE